MSDAELAGVVRSLKRFAALSERLTAKCSWEQMTPVAVLREWPEFVDEYRAVLAKVEVPDDERVTAAKRVGGDDA